MNVEDRMAVLERRLKVWAIAIAIFTLLASSASAGAAWYSYALMKENAELQGAVLEASSEVEITGVCDQTERSLAVRVSIVNRGRIAGTVQRVGVGILAGPDMNKPGGFGLFYTPAGSAETKGVVDAQGSTDFVVGLDCDIAQGAVNTTPLNIGARISEEVERRTQEREPALLTIFSKYALESTTLGKQVRAAYYSG